MRINTGETIGIIALSGECEKERVLKSKNFLEEKGYNVKLATNIFSKKRYLAGTEDEKLEVFYSFLQDPQIKLILCARGGYGAIRLINRLDYNVIKENPKIFCGYSDVTALLNLIYIKTGIVTYHAPMACSDFSLNDVSDFTWDNFINGINAEFLQFSGNKIYREGKAKGILFGGNLSTIVSLCGSEFLPNKDFIFVAEDLNEPVYKIDKMFNQLLNIKDFTNQCRGIVLGEFLDIDNKEWLDDLFNEIGNSLKIPVTSGFQITHARDKITIPIGAEAELVNKILKITNCLS